MDRRRSVCNLCNRKTLAAFTFSRFAVNESGLTRAMPATQVFFTTKHTKHTKVQQNNIAYSIFGYGKTESDPHPFRVFRVFRGYSYSGLIILIINDL